MKYERGLLFLMFAGFAGLSMLLRISASYNDYWTLFGFHLQKQGLSSILLLAAMAPSLRLAYSGARTKVTKISLLAIAVGSVFLFAGLLMPTLLKFNGRVNNGTLVERLGTISPLMMAAYGGNLRELNALIDSGTNVNARNDVNNTALHFAAGAAPADQPYHGSPAAVTDLLEHGADVDAQNNTGITPLMDAVINDNLESLSILVAHGADVNKVSRYDETALSMAILRAHAEFADPPSMAPFIRRYRDIAIELLRHGADPGFRDFTGLTSLQAAEKYHEDDIVSMMIGKR